MGFQSHCNPRSRYNSIHDVTQPPVLFANPKDRRVQVISLLFSDAQTHYADYIGNLMFEANACTYLTMASI